MPVTTSWKWPKTSSGPICHWLAPASVGRSVKTLSSISGPTRCITWVRSCIEHRTGWKDGAYWDPVVWRAPRRVPLRRPSRSRCGGRLVREGVTGTFAATGSKRVLPTGRSPREVAPEAALLRDAPRYRAGAALSSRTVPCPANLAVSASSPCWRCSPCPGAGRSAPALPEAIRTHLERGTASGAWQSVAGGPVSPGRRPPFFGTATAAMAPRWMLTAASSSVRSRPGLCRLTAGRCGVGRQDYA